MGKILSTPYPKESLSLISPMPSLISSDCPLFTPDSQICRLTTTPLYWGEAFLHLILIHWFLHPLPYPISVHQQPYISAMSHNTVWLSMGKPTPVDSVVLKRLAVCYTQPSASQRHCCSSSWFCCPYFLLLRDWNLRVWASITYPASLPSLFELIFSFVIILLPKHY